jgi:hypothetical protein
MRSFPSSVVPRTRRPLGTISLCFLLVAAICSGCARNRAEEAPAGQSSTAADTTGTREKVARSAAEAWLSVVDAGDYPQSWTDAAAGFKGVIDQPGWKKALDGVRAPLGKTLFEEIEDSEVRHEFTGRTRRRIRGASVRYEFRAQGQRNRNGDADQRGRRALARVGVFHQVSRRQPPLRGRDDSNADGFVGGGGCASALEPPEAVESFVGRVEVHGGFVNTEHRLQLACD